MLKAEKTSPGICQVTGDYIPIQIIKSRKLSAEENLWLNSLRNDLKAENVGVSIDEIAQTIELPIETIRALA